jgi:hypothetical protein
MMIPRRTIRQKVLDRQTGFPEPSGRMPLAPEEEVSSSAGRENPQRSRLGLVLLWSAVLTCPCHFPIIVLLGLGGTVLGVYFHAHLVLLFGLSAAYFAAALLVGMWLLHRSHTPGCATCASRAPDNCKQEEQEQRHDKKRIFFCSPDLLCSNDVPLDSVFCPALY